MIEQALQLTRHLVNPSHYFQGHDPRDLWIPQNVLLFTRRNFLELGGGERAQRFQHHRAVLIFILKGSGKIGVDARFYAVAPGDVILIRPFQTHSYRDVDEDSIQWVFVTFECAHHDWDQKLQSKTVFKLNEKLQIDFYELVKNYLRDAQSNEVFLRLSLLLEKFSEQIIRVPVEPSTINRDQTRLLSKIHDLVYRTESPLYFLSDIAREIAISESHLRFLFRSATGHSLGKHLTEIRIRKACFLLTSSELSIQKIADQTGFGSIYSFSRAFKQTMKQSPRQYRLRRRGD